MDRTEEQPFRQPSAAPIPKHGRCASLRFFNSLFRSQLTSLLPALRALGSLPPCTGEARGLKRNVGADIIRPRQQRNGAVQKVPIRKPSYHTRLFRSAANVKSLAFIDFPKNGFGRYAADAARYICIGKCDICLINSACDMI